MTDNDHDLLMRLAERVEMTEQQHEREIARLASNINAALVVMGVVVSAALGLIILIGD